jgi:HlyD family secretion protein
VAQLELARAGTQAARARLAPGRGHIAADARVLSRAVEPGQIVQPGRALMNLALSGPAQLTAQVDERFWSSCRWGRRPAWWPMRFAGQRFAARVLSVAPAVDPQRGTVEVKFELMPPVPSFLREDMTLSVEVETARRERALVVPLSALRTQGAGQSATVWVVSQDRVAARPVQLGLRTLDAVDVVQGLQPGDVVVLAGKAQPGDAVRPRTVAWQPGRGVGSAAGGGDAAAALSNAMGR